MTLRTTTRTATFAKPFLLGDDATLYPPGRYLVETDEELLENLSFVAYRRVATIINVPYGPGSMQAITIDPSDLEDASMSDGGPSQSVTVPTKGAPATNDRNADRDDLGRADDEGMVSR